MKNNIVYDFDAVGIPIPKGSAKAFKHRITGKVMVMQTNRDKQKPWAEAIKYAAIQHSPEIAIEPVCLEVEFRMPRIKSHFCKSGELKSTAPTLHAVKPDLDKLLRCVKDALTGVCYDDDALVVAVKASKRYVASNERPGAHIRIEWKRARNTKSKYASSGRGEE